MSEGEFRMHALSKFKQFKRKYRKFFPFPTRNKLRSLFPSKYQRNIVYLLNQHKITQVLDIGANTGQYASKLIGSGFKGEVISFEPIPLTHKELSYVASKYQNWKVAPPMALGEVKSSKEMYLYDSSALASSLPTREEAQDSNSAYKITGRIEVEQTTLDDAFTIHADTSKRTVIKMDVQGTEMDVLAGAINILPGIQGIHIELSLQPLYEGETYYLDMLQFLREQGFAVHFLSPISTKFRYGSDTQMDALLFRDPELLSNFKKRL